MLALETTHQTTTYQYIMLQIVYTRKHNFTNIIHYKHYWYCKHVFGGKVRKTVDCRISSGVQVVSLERLPIVTILSVTVQPQFATQIPTRYPAFPC